jgi:hypothetical protein
LTRGSIVGSYARFGFGSASASVVVKEGKSRGKQAKYLRRGHAGQSFITVRSPTPEVLDEPKR